MESAVLQRASLATRGRRLEYFTIAWNLIEGLVAVVAGAIAGSISLVGFGVDSFIEVTSGAVLLWRMNADADEHRRERIEQVSLRLIGGCFLVLAAYVGYEAVSSLVEKKAPEHSLPGIILACIFSCRNATALPRKTSSGNQFEQSCDGCGRQTNGILYLPFRNFARGLASEHGR